MTTLDPLDDILLPYSIVATVPENQRVLAPGYIALPEGVTTLQVTWSHDLRLNITISEVASHSARKKVAEVPAGEGRRTVVVPGIGVPAGAIRYLSLLCDTPPPVGIQASVQVITIPLQE